MEKLTITEASKRFGISRGRLYKLLDEQIVVGHKAPRQGRKANSWVEAGSLKLHIEQRHEKQRQSPGRPKAVETGEYFPTRVAAEKVGYSLRNVCYLVKNGRVKSKKVNGNALVYYPSLIEYKNRYKNN